MSREGRSMRNTKAYESAGASTVDLPMLFRTRRAHFSLRIEQKPLDKGRGENTHLVQYRQVRVEVL